MHSKVFNYRTSTDDTSFARSSQQAYGLLTYLGMPVFVDDTVPVAAGGTNGHVYTTYVIKAGAIRFGYSPPKNAPEVFRAPLGGNGAGADQLFQHDNFAFRVTGMSYSGSVVDRARDKHRDYDSFAAATFVAVAPFDCDPGRLLPSDLLTMGDVAKFEYVPTRRISRRPPKRTLKLTSELLNCCGFAATLM